MEDPNKSIRLVDNTAPRLPSSDEDDDPIAPITTASTDLSRSTAKRWRTPSVRASLRQRKYRKWQPNRLGLTDTNDPDAAGGMTSCDEGDLSRAGTNTNTIGADSLMSMSSYPTTNEQHDIQSVDFASSANDTQASGSGSGSGSKRTAAAVAITADSQLDILYENQRGWFFFGVPLYSHSSLLNFDPSAWVTGDLRDSPVNITNAQLPDPSWEWAWKTWYVDMSGDVDDQGWQYSYSFSSSAWHGSHPWFHSFVRRRRWVRLRAKRAAERGRPGRTEFEMAHQLNEDYFTIHSASKRRASSVADPMSRMASARPTRSRMDEVLTLEEVSSIPALLHAMKTAVVDREKLDSLDRFLHEGGYELYYLDERMPEIMSLFVFQASRWQFLTHLTEFINELSREESRTKDDTEIEDLRRRKGYLIKAAETASRHLTGPEIFSTLEGATQMLDLTPRARRGSLMSKHSRNFSYPPMNNGGQIKGISSKADIGREGHIY